VASNPHLAVIRLCKVQRDMGRKELVVVEGQKVRPFVLLNGIALASDFDPRALGRRRPANCDRSHSVGKEGCQEPSRVAVQQQSFVPVLRTVLLGDPILVSGGLKGLSLIRLFRVD
jgi:hypothetical protein